MEPDAMKPDDMEPDVIEPDAIEPDAMETEVKRARATPRRVFGVPRRVQFTLLIIIVGGILGLWLIGPFRAAKVETSTDTAASSEAAGYQLTPQQWATMRTAKVEEMEFLPQRQAEGKIAVDEHLATAVYPPYNGRVTAVFVHTGDTVKQGQPLFRLDSTDLVQAINNVVVGKAALAKAQSQLNLTKTAEDRAHQLYLAKGGSLKDWQQAQADLTAAQNDLKSAEIGLSAAQDQLRIIRVQSGETDTESLTRTSPDLNVLAPISGEVLMRKLGVGQYISQGATDPIMLIGDLSTVWLVDLHGFSGPLRSSAAGRPQREGYFGGAPAARGLCAGPAFCGRQPSADTRRRRVAGSAELAGGTRPATRIPAQARRGKSVDPRNHADRHLTRGRQWLCQPDAGGDAELSRSRHRGVAARKAR
jgi:multidrug efflux pump subunit AcrA (membrane-fusion protein)